MTTFKPVKNRLMQKKEAVLTVREITIADIELITNYWTKAKDAFLVSMGVDLNKMPVKSHWVQMLTEQINQSYQEKKSYCTIWQINGNSIGHCNVNKIIFEKEAYMHLHIWDADLRQKGYGLNFIKMTTPYFFQNLKLKNLFCEPYSINTAPNKTLEKAGFEFVKKYITTPGSINFEQEVNQWLMTKDRFNIIK